MHIAPVSTAHVHQTWPLVKGMLEEVFKTGGVALYTVENVLQYVASGEWLMLVAVNDAGEIKGVATVSFINYPLHRVAFITAIAGKLISNKTTYAQLCVILKAHGATMLQGYGRDAIARLWKRYDIVSNGHLLETLL